jgi:hypothetical protein
MTRHARPLALQRAIARQLAKDAAPAAPPRPMPGSWEAFVGDFRARRIAAPPSLLIVLPGLILPSYNAVMAGYDRIRNQSAAVRAARDAFMAHPPPAVAFLGQVRICVDIRAPRYRIDALNQSGKALIDCLCERGGGLGIIPDDGPRWVRGGSVDYLPEAGEPCVWVTIREVEK